jgi:uncharacterized membrane protein
MLVVFPLGLLGSSVLFDLAYLATGNGRWADIAYWMIVCGVLGGVIAALFGLVDWLAIPRGTRAWSVGLAHALANSVVLALFGASWLLRADAPEVPGALAIGLSLLGVAVAVVGGWLGGELVNRHGIGVHRDADLNAPSSLARGPLR